MPPVLVAVLAASLSSAAGIWKRWRTVPAQAGGMNRDGGPRGSADPPGEAAPPASFTPQVAVATDTGRMFRGDRTHRHRSAFTGPTSLPAPRFAWDAGGAVEAMPALTREGDIVVASLSGKVARLSPQGTVTWTAQLGERIYSSPLILGDSVVIGSDAKRVAALALATGKRRWELDVDGEADTAAAETPDGGVVIAAGRVLYGLRADGAVRFRLAVRRKIYASPAVADDGTIYVGSQDHHLYAVSPRGSVVWSRDLGADVDCSPAVGDDGTVYVGSDGGEVTAFDPAGSQRWRVAVGGFVRGGLTVSRAGPVLVGTYGPGPRVVALDPKTGAERWAFAIQGTGAPEFGIHGAPLEDAEGRLYFGAQDDRVYALDPAGHLLWSYPTGGDVDAPLTLGRDGVLYAGSDDGHLYALR